MTHNLTIIILTLNEQKKIRRLLDSIKDITQNIFIVDSHSTDDTLKIASDYGVKYVKRKFTNYADQRNWSQINDPFNSDWVMHLDADEPITSELYAWLKTEFHHLSFKYDGFLFSRKVYFMGKWIRHGGQYPNYHLRLFRKSLGSCEEKAYDQHFILSTDNYLRVKNAEIENTVCDNLSQFVQSHNKWAELEATEQFLQKKFTNNIQPKLFGSPIERRRWQKLYIFQNIPIFMRPFLYFFYVYFIRLGFRDGKQGLIYFILQAFWFRFLVDAKIYEMTQADKETNEKNLRCI